MTATLKPRSRGFFMTATDTGVGKTFVGTQIVRTLTARGIPVAVRKPAESGCEEHEGELVPADARALWLAADQREPLATVCPLRFRHALSPARAAMLEGEPLTLDRLADAVSKDVGETWLHVEGAGGICSPIAADGLNADLLERLALPALLVVPDRLGGINQALMGVSALRERKLELAAIVLNAVEEATDPAMDNLAELRDYLSIPVFRTGHGVSADVSALVDHLTEYVSDE